MLRQRFRAVVGVSVPTIREQPFLFLTALGHDGGEVFCPL